MKSEITKNIILDMLPMYMAGEVSDETSALVEAFLETDPTLAAKVASLIKKETSAVEKSHTKVHWEKLR